ncbi:Integrin betanu subunit [Carabus blaptoides fortunei]
MKLRPGDTEVIKLKYRGAKNYPLDLYCLVDSSYSMKDDLETIVTLGNELTNSLSQLTTNYRLGFGAFSDKVAMPFAQMDEASLKNPCRNAADANTVCIAGFGFKHWHNLNSNITEFIDKMNSTRVTANLDNAEGVLDALMQAVICNEPIEWKDESRKLILILTNGLMHYAGDGKLAGITKKVDGLCHLDSDGYYTESNKQDYPSISQINTLLRMHKTYVIFAVTTDYINHYKKMNDLIPSFTYVTQLDADSSNIINVIKKGYEDVISLIEFQDKAHDSIDIEYYSTCNGQTKNTNATNVCYQVKQGQVYEFVVHITLKHCPADKAFWKQTIVIDEIHLEKESLTIDLELLCGCACGESKRVPGTCSDHGVIECGTCKCDSPWSGEQCDCNGFERNRDSDMKCRQVKDNSTSLMCHARGECVCGKCNCDSSYSGIYCECKKCPTTNDLECGGHRHGLCNCGTCLCMEGFTGTDCSCTKDIYPCIENDDNVECNGNGKCECGKCKCDSEKYSFFGNFCERCSNCDGLCDLFKDCVTCKILESCKGPECDPKEISKVEMVDFLEDDTSCVVYTNHSNYQQWLYSYRFYKKSAHIKILSQSSQTFIQTSTIAYGSFVFILIIGSVSLLGYKLKIVRDDKREYAEFMKSIGNTKFVDNDDYKSPITMYMVPRRSE